MSAICLEDWPDLTRLGPIGLVEGRTGQRLHDSGDPGLIIRSDCLWEDSGVIQGPISVSALTFKNSCHF